MNDATLLLLLAPVVLVQLALLVIALRDLVQADRRVRGGNKWVWGVIIVVVNIVGPLLYLTVGRDDE